MSGARLPAAATNNVEGSSEELATITESFERIFGTSAEIIEARRMTQAIDNKSFRVAYGSHHMVAKLPNRAPGESLGTESEVGVIEKVAEAGLGPRLHGYDIETGVIVTEYLAGASPWSPAGAGTGENIDRIADSLSLLHELQADIRTFDPLAWAELYLSSCRTVLSAHELRMADELLLLSQAWGKSGETVLCHNDLVAANILDDGRLWLVDFEYAVAAAPIVDIASVAAMNDYGQAQLERLVRSYSARRSLMHGVEDVANTVRIHKLIAHFWGVARRAALVQTAASDEFR